MLYKQNKSKKIKKKKKKTRLKFDILFVLNRQIV